MNPNTQETYYKEIVETYKKLIGSESNGNDLDKAFKSLSLNGAIDSSAPSAAGPAVVVTTRQNVQSKGDLAVVLQAMRKIREALLASSRVDTFARSVYVFIIRATILTRHMESYHPALLHLLHRIHPAIPLPVQELQEFLGYYILDLACRQADLGTAFSVRHQYRYTDARIDMVLKALVHGNWFVFWKISDEVNEYQRELMAWADDRMRQHALGCLGRTYLKVHLNYVEKVSQRKWAELTMMNGINWERGGDAIIIRTAQRK